MRLLLATLVLHYNLTLAPESAKWNEQKTWLLWEKGELWFTLQRAPEVVRGEKE